MCLWPGVGTGGTITGIGRYLKERNPNIVIVGADPEGSIYTDDKARPYKVEGIGEDFMPGTFQYDIVDRWVQVGDRDSLLTARRVTREEGILIGGSGGTAMWAALQVARDFDASKTVVVLLPDTGRGYLSKVFNDDWMRENGFLDRLATPARVRDILSNHNRELPALVTVPVTAKVREGHRTAAPVQHLAVAGLTRWRYEYRPCAGRLDPGAVAVGARVPQPGGD